MVLSFNAYRNQSRLTSFVQLPPFASLLTGYAVMTFWSHQKPPGLLYNHSRVEYLCPTLPCWHSYPDMSNTSFSSSLQIHRGWTAGIDSLVHRYTPHICSETTSTSMETMDHPTCPGCQSRLSLNEPSPQHPSDTRETVKTLYVTLQPAYSSGTEAAILRIDVKSFKADSETTFGIGSGSTKCYLFSKGDHGDILQTQQSWDPAFDLNLNQDCLAADLLSHFQSILSRRKTRANQLSYRVLRLLSDRTGSLSHLAGVLAQSVLVTLEPSTEVLGVRRDSVPQGAIDDLADWNAVASMRESNAS